ncbi:unnamed protein product [Effrenium voratum]|nr:unnamed protein product [Effrenium voratum]
MRRRSLVLALLVLGPAFSLPRGAQRFLLARHGQTTFNAENRFQGCMDEEPVLTAKGREQAKELGEWLKGQDLDQVFVSPLLRARDTLSLAKEVAGDALPEATTLRELREIELHEWEGRTQVEIKAEKPELMRQWKEEAWRLQLGGRYVVRDLWHRAEAAWGLMREASPEEGRSLIVAHGTLSKGLLATAMGLSEQAFRHFHLSNGEVVEVAWHAEGSGTPKVQWRKLHPVKSPWRSRADEEEAMQKQDLALEEVEAA